MKKAIQLGAGNIGRGFIGGLLEQAGYHVLFADVNDEIINKINEDRCYTIHVKDEICSEEKICNISALNSNDEKLISEIASADIVTTAVGLTILKFIAPTIAKGIETRLASKNESYLNIIACENAVRGSTTLKELVYEHLSDEAKAFAVKFIGFPDCSVDRIVPPVRSDNFIDVVVENYFEWNVEKGGFKGEIPEIVGMNLAEDLMPYIERKLFTLNTGHAITSYLGYLNGYKTVEESIKDEAICIAVKFAMQESGYGLIKKYDFDSQEHMKYIDKILARFRNKYLNDDVNRVGREPLRKLSATDRLVKPLLTAYGYGYPVEYLIKGIAAALKFKCDDDAQSVSLQNEIVEKGINSAIRNVTGITDESLIAKIEFAYNCL